MIHYVSNHMSDRLKKEKTSEPAIRPWQKLANAIVEQAVEDYRKAQARIKANPMIADHGLRTNVVLGMMCSSFSVIALEEFKSLFEQIVQPAKVGNLRPGCVVLDLGALFKSARQFQQAVLD